MTFSKTLEDYILEFIVKYGPEPIHGRYLFCKDLKKLLERYGEAAIQHGALPDTEHAHGSFRRKPTNDTKP